MPQTPLPDDLADRFRVLVDYLGPEDCAGEFQSRFYEAPDEALTEIRRLLAERSHPDQMTMEQLAYRYHVVEDGDASQIAAGWQGAADALASLTADGVIPVLRLLIGHRSICVMPDPPLADRADDRLTRLNQWICLLWPLEAHIRRYNALGYDVYVDRIEAGHVRLGASDRRDGLRAAAAPAGGRWVQNFKVDADAFAKVLQDES